MRCLLALLFSSLALASVQLPVEMTLVCTGTGTSTTCSTGTTAATFNLASEGSDPNNYLHLQISNLELENLLTVDTKGTIHSPSANKINVTGTMTGIANGQVVMCADCPGGYGHWVTVTSHSGASVTLSGDPCSSCGANSEAIQFATPTPEGSVQVNSNTAIPLISANIAYDPGIGNCPSAGGLGGAISTCWVTLTIPKTQFNSGASNTLTFSILTTDGNTSSYRILAFNVYQNHVNGSGACVAPFTDVNGVPVAGCDQLISSGQFLPWSTAVNDAQLGNAPFAAVNNPTGISNGATLFSTASLAIPASGGGSSSAITAKCSSCHFADGTHASGVAGADLYYFNYSPQTILARGMFHGLTQTQSAEIAVYIESLGTPNPAAPWSYAYQPGPGLDEGPVDNWAAGIGGQTVNGILTSTDDMVRYIAPTGTALDFDPTATPHQHEIPVPFPMLTWNQWLPKVYPGDIAGAGFAGSAMLADYNTLAGALIPNNTGNYASNIGNFTNFDNDEVTFCNSLQTLYGGITNQPFWTAAQSNNIYSCSQWMASKQFELNHIYGLEAEAQSVGFPTGMNRAWLTQRVFFTSPSINHLPVGQVGSASTFGVLNGTANAFEFASYNWYQIAILLNMGWQTFACTVPIDTGYFYGFLSGQSQRANTAVFGYELYQHQLFAQMLQNGNHPGPPGGCGGYLYDPIAPDEFSNPAGPLMMSATTLPAPQIASLYTSYLQQLYNTNKAWTPAQWYVSSNNGCAGLGGSYSCFGPADTIQPGGWFAGTGWSAGNCSGGCGLSSLFSYWIPRVKYWSTDTATVENWIYYATQLWPSAGYNWWGLLGVTCTTGAPTPDVTCNNDSSIRANTILMANSSAGTVNVSVAGNSGFVNGSKISIGASTAHPEACTLNSGAGTTTFNVTCGLTHSSGDLVGYSPGPNFPMAPTLFFIQPPVSFVQNVAISGHTVQFTAGPSYFVGTDVWSVVSGPGSINSGTGVYTPPGSPPATTAKVIIQDVRGAQTQQYAFYVQGAAYQL
jgi:hypothetical protein